MEQTGAAGKNANFQANSDKFGDAVWETSSNDAGASWNLSWNSDASFFPDTSSAFFMRGGSFINGSFCGLFAFYATGGGVTESRSFRPVIVVP